MKFGLIWDLLPFFLYYFSFLDWKDLSTLDSLYFISVHTCSCLQTFACAALCLKICPRFWNGCHSLPILHSNSSQYTSLMTSKYNSLHLSLLLLCFTSENNILFYFLSIPSVKTPGVQGFCAFHLLLYSWCPEHGTYSINTCFQFKTTTIYFLERLCGALSNNCCLFLLGDYTLLPMEFRAWLCGPPGAEA